MATDPTSRNSLTLRLMALDPAPSILLGRPCYFGLYRDHACKRLFWTLRRYGPEVLDSMEAVLRAEMIKAGAPKAELFGHSGSAVGGSDGRYANAKKGMPVKIEAIKIFAHEVLLAPKTERRRSKIFIPASMLRKTRVCE